MKKFFLVFVLISISTANPVENSSTLISIVKGIFEHADELQFNENIEDLKTSDRNCIWQNLKLTPRQDIEAVKITDFDTFKNENLKNVKIFKAVNVAASFCESEISAMKHFVDIANILAAMHGKDDVDLECITLEFQKLEPNSKLIEGFKTTKTVDECQKDEDNSSYENSSSEEDEMAEINECLAKNRNKKNPQTIRLAVKILAWDLNDNEKVNEVAKIMMEASKEEMKIILNCILKDFGIN